MMRCVCPRQASVAVAVLLSWISSVSWAWVSNSCLVLDEASPTQFNWCPRSDLTAVCNNVTNEKMDLPTVPADIQVLCLRTDGGLVLQSDIFARFHSLRSIYIKGRLSAVFPGAFKGVTSLLQFSLVSSRKTNVTIASKALGDLQGLEELVLKGYALSGMAPDVFDGLDQLRRLEVLSPDERFSELLCRLVSVSMSLETLHVTMGEMETLEASNYSAGLSGFPALHNISFAFPNVKAIERDALRYFKRVSELSMPLNDLLQAQLLESGIQRIDHLKLTLADLNVESVCELTLVFNVTEISLSVSMIEEFQLTAWEGCKSLESLTLTSMQHCPLIDLSFIHILRNLKELVVFFHYRSEVIDETLSSLCIGQGSFGELRSFSYRSLRTVILRAKQFACLQNLEYLHLTETNLKIEDFAFEGLHKLQSLWIFSYDHNCTFALASFMGLQQLHTLFIHGAAAWSSAISATYLRGLENLLILTIRHHSVQVIEDFTFKGLWKLVFLDLSYNHISVVTANTFSGLRELQTLLLESNPLKHIEASAFSHFPSLQIFSLGFFRLPVSEHQNMEQLLNLSLLFGMFPQQLSDLSITSVSPMTLVITDDSAPKVDLKLRLCAKQILLLGCERHFVKSVAQLYVTADRFLCGPDSSSALGHFSSVQQLHFSHWSVSTVQDLSGLNRLVHLKQLDLQKVNLDSPGINVMFHNLTKLESLSLCSCWADSLEGSLTADLTSLKYLQLDIMSETSLTKAFFEPLANLKCVILYNFQLRCNCENAWFDGWARQQSRVEVFLFSSQQRALQCQSEGGLEELERFGQEHCSLDVGLVLFSSTTSFLLLFMLVVLLQQLASDYLLAFFHIAGGWLNEALRRNTRRRYLYDAFVSYSSRDEQWVMEELLPNLEQPGPPFLRLCLHSRDFQLGKDVVENITDSLYASRRTLCLVSRHFLHSTWCSLELRLATYRLQVERRDVLILVFLEDIPSGLLSAHHRLARLLKTRTYIHWPHDPAQQQPFWDRLRAKLAPPGE